jgi:hypothetical protein
MFLSWKRLCIIAVFSVCTLSIYADNSRVFSMPDSTLLFGTYDELRLVTPDRAEAIKPPARVTYNQGYFAYPTISPKSDLIAWGFALKVQRDRTKPDIRFTMGVYSIADKSWKTYGDFDDVGQPAFSPDGLQIVFIAKRENTTELLILDVASGSMKSAPHPATAFSPSWSPDSKRLVLNTTQPSHENPSVTVFNLNTGSIQSLGEGVDPRWSPNGEWIAYYDPSGAKCLLVHPDATEVKVVRTLKQSTFSYRRFGWDGPVWSPDSKQLLLTEMKGDGNYSDVVLLDVVTGHVTRRARNVLPIFGWAARPK